MIDTLLRQIFDTADAMLGAIYIRCRVAMPPFSMPLSVILRRFTAFITYLRHAIAIAAAIVGYWRIRCFAATIFITPPRDTLLPIFITRQDIRRCR